MLICVYTSFQQALREKKIEIRKTRNSSNLSSKSNIRHTNKHRTVSELQDRGYKLYLGMNQNSTQIEMSQMYFFVFRIRIIFNISD